MSPADHRFMAAAIRIARRNEGLTASNPSVACLLVKDGVILGSGVTAPGGRPHAEPLAIAQAMELNATAVRGATAYVTLEPCAHHGRTPPCAQALIDAGVARVVTAVTDPDDRVCGKGHAMLEQAGIEVVTGVLEDEARQGLAAYLLRKRMARPFVTLKLAVSADGLIGRRGGGQAAVTGPGARAQSHLMRATNHAILIGAGTAIADDPLLTCRLPGLEKRSPVRIVLDAGGRLAASSALARSARDFPLWIASPPETAAQQELRSAGAEFLACELHEGRIALPELLEDIAARGVMSLLVEGGAQVARSFLEEGLVDEIALFSSPHALAGEGEGVASPLTEDAMAAPWRLTGQWRFGEDRLTTWRRD
jgi:diaminohydroxyphosphoribosylaminopyrimidine deaminase/5-amino-6-(5-phosphoribosylamino)uracil reductase